MSLKENFEIVKNNNKWKSKSRIIGRAAELYCLTNIKCPNCSENTLWKECKVNQKSKDQICSTCNKSYQIKCKKVSNNNYSKIINTNKFKTLGAEYKTTLNSINDNIDYLILLYNNQLHILNILYISSDNFNESNIIPRKPLSDKARRAGWQGCYLYFDNFICLL